MGKILSLLASTNLPDVPPVVKKQLSQRYTGTEAQKEAAIALRAHLKEIRAATKDLTLHALAEVISDHIGLDKNDPLHAALVEIMMRVAEVAQAQPRTIAGDDTKSLEYHNDEHARDVAVSALVHGSIYVSEEGKFTREDLAIAVIAGFAHDTGYIGSSKDLAVLSEVALREHIADSKIAFATAKPRVVETVGKALDTLMSQTEKNTTTSRAERVSVAILDGIGKDVTEEFSNSLNDKEKKCLTALLEQGKEAIIATDMSGAGLAANKAARKESANPETISIKGVLLTADLTRSLEDIEEISRNSLALAHEENSDGTIRTGLKTVTSDLQGGKEVEPYREEFDNISGGFIECIVITDQNTPLDIGLPSLAALVDLLQQDRRSVMEQTKGQVIAMQAYQTRHDALKVYD